MRFSGSDNPRCSYNLCLANNGFWTLSPALLLLLVFILFAFIYLVLVVILQTPTNANPLLGIQLIPLFSPLYQGSVPTYYSIISAIARHWLVGICVDINSIEFASAHTQLLEIFVS